MMLQRVAPEALLPAPTTPIELAKRAAARAAVDTFVRSGMDVGVGSGSTIVYAIQRLAELVHGEAGFKLRCVPTSFQSRQLCNSAGLIVTDLSPACPRLDVTIDGADEVDAALDCVKGGGGCQTLEKIVAAAAETFVVVTDFSKRSPRLLVTWRKGVPVEVLPAALTPVEAALRRMGGTPALRMGAPAKAGPAVTDNGNLIIDVDFESGKGLSPGQAARLHAEVKGLPGVVETGLFVGIAKTCFFGEADGSISVLERRKELEAPLRE